MAAWTMVLSAVSTLFWLVGAVGVIMAWESDPGPYGNFAKQNMWKWVTAMSGFLGAVLGVVAKLLGRN